MGADNRQIQQWLAEEWTSRLASAFEAMEGERPSGTSNVLNAAPDWGEAALRWRQPLPPLAGGVWVVASAESVNSSGAHVLRAVGVEDSSEEERKSTFLEILSQALAGLAQSLTTRLKREVNCSGGAQSAAQPGTSAWTSLSFSLGETPVTFGIGMEDELAEAVRVAELPPVPQPDPGPPVPRSPADNSKTFELLLDVQLPVAVSFGRANIPLKDVLKLNTGSIVELDRTVTEPVEIIVNNCVIARGEVVVVEGNFGVRVQEVVNRQERLRTVR